MRLANRVRKQLIEVQRLILRRAEWRRYCDIECAPEAAIAALVSAQPLDHLMLRCMYFMTELCIEEIDRF